jgi:hypothetical protein
MDAALAVDAVVVHQRVVHVQTAVAVSPKLQQKTALKISSRFLILIGKKEKIC